MKKRMISIVMTMLLLLTMAPAGVFAADANGNITVKEITIVPKPASEAVGINKFHEGIAYYTLLKDLGGEPADDETNNEAPSDNSGPVKGGAIDMTGKDLFPNYHTVWDFSEGLASVSTYDEANDILKYGYIDKTGKEVVPVRYDSAWDFREGLAGVGKYEGGVYKYGYIDKTGKEVIPFSYAIANYFSEGVAGVCKYVDEILKYGYIDKTGKEVIPFSYDNALSFSEGLSAVEKEEKWGVIDKTGKEIVPFIYSYIGIFSEGLAVVAKAEGEVWKYGYIDKTGKEVIPITYDSLGDFSEGLALVGRYENGNWKYGYIDKTGKEVIPVAYDYAYSFNEGLAGVSKGGKYAYIDQTGKELTEFIYEYANDFSDSLAAAKRGDTWVILQKTSGSASTGSDKPSSWAEAQVNTAIAANLVPQSLQSKYTQATTRAEFCALAVTLYETVTGKEIAERKTFDDTADVNVEKAAAIGVVSGTGDGVFSPNNNLTREQAAVMLAALARALEKPLASNAATFADMSSISSWATESVGQIQSSGIMSGVGDNKFAPKNPYTREQSIITINKLFDAMK